MKKLVLRWAGLLAFVATLAVVFVLLGDWQLSRLDGRKASNAHVVANQNEPVRPYRDVLGGPIAADDQWRRVTLRGEFDPTRQLLVRYRSYDNKTGAEVLTPLRTEQGDWVIVDRGFIVRETNQLDPEVLPAPPPGVVEVTGYVRQTEVGKPEATDPVEGKVRLVNPPAISTTHGRSYLDGYVSLISVEPAQTGDLIAMKPPPLDEGPHFWYAVQWFCFTLIALGGFIVLVRADLRDRKKRLAKRAKAAAEAPADA